MKTYNQSYLHAHRWMSPLLSGFSLSDERHIALQFAIRYVHPKWYRIYKVRRMARTFHFLCPGRGRMQAHNTFRIILPSFPSFLCLINFVLKDSVLLLTFRASALPAVHSLLYCSTVDTFKESLRVFNTHMFLYPCRHAHITCRTRIAGR